MAVTPSPGPDRRVDRRTILRAAAAAGAVAAGTTTASAAADDPLRTGYHPASDRLGNQDVVVYSRSRTDDLTLCGTRTRWAHGVVELGGGDDPAYSTLYADERLAPGSVLTFVDRLTRCEEGGRQYLTVFFSVDATPPSRPRQPRR